MRQTSPFEQLRVVFFFVAPLPSAAVSRFSHSVGRVAPFRDKVLEQGAYKEAAKRASLYIFRRVYIYAAVSCFQEVAVDVESPHGSFIF